MRRLVLALAALLLLPVAAAAELRLVTVDGSLRLEWDVDTQGTRPALFKVCTQRAAVPNEPYTCTDTTTTWVSIDSYRQTGGEWIVNLFSCLDGGVGCGTPVIAYLRCTTDCTLPSSLEAETHARAIDIRIEEIPPIVVRPMARAFTRERKTFARLDSYPGLSPLGTRWTVLVWFKLADPRGSAGQRLIAKWADSCCWPPTGYEWIVQVGPDGKLLGAIFDGQFRIINGQHVITPNEWHRLVLRQDGTGATALTLWLDEELDAVGPAGAAPLATSTPILIGAGGSASSQEGWLDGLLAYPTFWTVALTNEQIPALRSGLPRAVAPTGVAMSLVDHGAAIRDAISGAALVNVGATYSNEVPLGGTQQP